MATNENQRQAVDAIPQRRETQRGAGTVDTFVAPTEAPKESRTSRVARGIFEFTGAAMDTAVRDQMTKIELDKVTQQQRALQGLDPTDEATKAGLRAYQIVGMRDKVLEANNALAQKVRDFPDMSDEEYERASRETYSPILQQFQADPELSKAASNKIQEAQVQTHQIRSAAQREHREFKSQESFGQAVELYREASSSPEELREAIEGGQLYREGRALGVNDAQQRTMLMQSAKMDAESGDDRLLQAIEGTEWASRDPRVQAARESHDTWRAEENAVAIGAQMGNIQMAWKTRQASWEQTQAALERLNDQFPGSVSSAQVASLKQAGFAEHSAASARAADAKYNWETFNDPNRIPVGMDPTRSSAQNKAYIEQSMLNADKRVQQRVAEGEISPEQATQEMFMNRLAFGRRERIKVDGIASMIESVTTVDPDDYEGEMPDWMKASMSVLPALNEGDMDLYGLSAEERAFINNYNSFREGPDPDPRAFQRAHNYRTGSTTLSAEESQMVRENAEQAAEDKIHKNWIERAFGQSAPNETFKNWMRGQVRQTANEMVGAGATNYESVGDSAAERVSNNITPLSGGTWITRSADRISAGSGDTIGQSEVDPAFTYFFSESKETLQIESGRDDISMGDVYFDVNEANQVQIYDDLGMPLLPYRVPVQDIGQKYRDDVGTERVNAAIRAAQGDGPRETGRRPGPQEPLTIDIEGDRNN